MRALIDSHSHLDASEFDADRDEVIVRARTAGVLVQVLPAVAAAGWPALHALTTRQRGLYPAYGLHPVHLEQHTRAHLDDLQHWLDAHPQTVAVGECGLDFHLPDPDPGLQRMYLDAQLDIALQRGLPVILHARRALDEVLAALRRRPGLRGVVHSFSGSAQQARQLWDLGFLIGIGGPVTYPRAQRLRGIVAGMPIEFLLLETDSPDQPDSDWRGQRNEPSRLPRIVAEVAALRCADVGHLADTTAANARRLFALPDDRARTCG